MATEGQVALIAVDVDASKAGASLDGLASKSEQTFTRIESAAGKSGKSIGTLGDGAAPSAEKMDRATRSMVQSIERATAAFSAGSKSSAEYYTVLAKQRGIDPAVLQPYLDALDKVAPKQRAATEAMAATLPVMKQYEQSAKATANALRQVPSQFTDIFVSLQTGQAPLTVLLQQGGQLKDMFGGVGNAARAMGSYVAGLVNPFTLGAAAVGVLTYGYYEGSKEADAFRKTLILTGGAAGVTTGQLSALAGTLDGLDTTQSKAAESLNIFAQAGITGAANLERFTLAAIRLESVGGGAVAETAKQFAELGKDPLRASVKLNESTNFLTQSVYDQIKALEDQGKTVEAARIAQDAYATTVERAASDIVGNLGYIERGWMAVVKASKEAIDAVKGIGRGETAQELLEKMLQRKANAEQLARAAAGRGQTVNSAVNAELDKEIAALSRRVMLQMDSAQLDAQRAEQLKASIKWSQDENKFLSDKVKLEREIAKVRAEGMAAGAAQADIDERVAKLQASFDKKNNGPARLSDAAKGISLYNDLISKGADYAADYAEKIGLLAAAYAKGAINATELSAAVKQLNSEQKFAKDEAKAWEDQTKASNKAVAESIREYEKLVSGYQNAADAAQKSAQKLEDEEKALVIATAQNISLARAIEMVEIARLREAQAAQLAAGNQEAADAIKAEIAAREKLIGLIGNKEARDANAKAAKQAAEDWKKAAEKIEESITDALMRGFENGKDFATNLRDTVVNMFKTMVLRPVVSAIVNPVAGAITGALGLGGAANAATAVNNGSAVINGASMFSNIGGLGNPFSNIGGFLGNGVADFGTKLFDMGFEKLGSSFESFGLTMKANEGLINGFGDALGYLNAAMLASDGKWGSAVGAGIGTYFGGPIGSVIGQAIGGWVDDAFGGGREYTTGTGITGTFSKGSFSGSNYQDWRNNGSSGFFGIGASGSSSGTNYSALNKATADGLSQGFMAIQIAAAGMSASLGLDAKKIATYSQNIRVALGNDAAANKKVIEDLFSSIANNVAKAVAPNIEQFSKSGETASATLARLSSSIVTSNSWLGLLRQRLFQVSLSGADAASKLADAFGGLDKLTASSQAFYESYYSNAEKVTANQKAMTDTLAALGLALPNTKEQFKALALSMDLNTESGRVAYATLLQLAPQFAATADLAAQAAKDTAKALLTAFTANGQLVPALNAATLSLEGVQAGADEVVSGMTQIRSVMLDVNSPVLTFTGTVGTLSTELTGAQKSSLLLQDQIEDLSGASSKAAIDFDGLINALQGSGSAVFIETIGLVFDNLAERIGGVVDSIATERVALREAAIQIVNPTVLSKAEIQRGISSIGTSLPSNAGVVAANAALATADASVVTTQKSLESAKASIEAISTTTATFTADVERYKALSAQFSSLGAANRLTTTGFEFNSSTNRVNAYQYVSGLVSDLFGSAYQNFITTVTGKPTLGGKSATDIANANSDSIAGQLNTANSVLAASEQALVTARANAVTDLAPYTAAVTAATTAQKAAEAAAAKALLDYQKALQNFALDAGKSVAKLSNLRQETVKYYEAQKALADLMQTSAANLLSTVASYRFQQLSPEAQSASLQTQFSVAYAAALASQKDGTTLAQYADKLNSTLGPLIESLNATGQDNLINSFLAQAETVAKLLQDNAPKNYQADSLALLGDIDATLAALEASSKSAEQVISDAVTAGSDRTAAGLYAVIQAITGNTIPAFASGGAYGGGLALVGEQGPELIDFNQPGQVYNASQTAGMFGNGGAVVAELQAMRSELASMRAETRSTAISSSKTAKILERVTPDGVSIQTVAA